MTLLYCYQYTTTASIITTCLLLVLLQHYYYHTTMLLYNSIAIPLYRYFYHYGCANTISIVLLLLLPEITANAC